MFPDLKFECKFIRVGNNRPFNERGVRAIAPNGSSKRPVIKIKNYIRFT